MNVPLPEQTRIGDVTAYLDGLLRHADAVITVRDAAEGRFLLVNHAFEQLVGRPAAQVLGRTPHDVLPAATAAEYRTEDRRVLESGAVQTSHQRLAGADGTEHTFVTQRFPLVDATGAVYAVGLIATEVTELEQVRASLAETEQRYRALVEHSPLAIVVHVEGTFRYANAAAVRLLGARDEADLIGRPVLDVIPEADRREATSLIARILAGESEIAGRREVVRLDGTRIIVEVTAAAVPWEGRAAVQVEVRDVTEETRSRVLLARAREEAREERAAHEARFRTMFLSSPVAMALSDSNAHFVSVNPAFSRMLGLPAEEVVGRSADVFTHPDDVPGNARISATLDHTTGQVYRVEKRYLHASGRVVWGLLSVTRVTFPDGEPYTLAQVEDITDRRRAEADLHRQARHDALTGLANRASLGRSLSALAQSGDALAVLFVDLDGFKLVNDTHGHSAGDEVLREVARRLPTAVRPGDLVARFGGDEFVVVCCGVAGRREALRVAAQVERALAAPIPWGSGSLVVTASVGIALTSPSAGEQALEGEELIRRADAAMYLAKRRGKDRADVYDHSLHATSQSRTRTAAALRRGLAGHGLQVHFQPIVDLGLGEVVCAEALVKMVDEDGTLVRTTELVDVAEETGPILQLGAWVLRQACADVARLRHDTGWALAVTVNLSARQAARPDLAASVLEVLAETGLDPDGLSLELTESALLDFNDATLTQLNTLRDHGVGIGIDDFGTGYSSLTYLRRFPVSFIKVDRAFVRGLPGSERDAVIVRTVNTLARDLGLACVVEGVETASQLHAVRELGGRFAQGYYFSRPVPLEELRELVVRGITVPPRR